MIGAVQASSRGLRSAASCLAAGIGLAVLAVQPPVAGATETDQFTLPVGREFADLRVYVSRTVHTAIVEAVNEANAAASEPGDDAQRLQTPDGIVTKVWERLYVGFSINEAIDATLGGAAVRSRYPGLVVAYRPEQHLYDHPLLLIDVTKLVRTLWRASTINVNGNLLGTDKLVHFVHMGHIYHMSYRGARASGATEEEAVARAAGLSSGYNIFFSEGALLGMWVTGVRSNADLAANYAGFKFYRNLIEPVRIGVRVLPPMLVREGNRWRIDSRVRPDSDFFAVFVTPHWNEALNPNTYAPLVDAVVRSMLQKRCPDVVDWYRDERGRRRDREQFAALERELATFYGEPYGHRDDGEDTVSIAKTCFPGAGSGDASRIAASADPTGSGARTAAPAARTAAQPRPPQWPGADELGRTELWWAARDGQLETVVRLLAQAENPNATDVDGEGPLHAAARRGHVAVVEVLLASSADPDAKALYGTTPLHAAVGEGQAGAALALLRKGVEVNARDAFGRTPLHQAVGQGDRELAGLLLDYGAYPAAVYAGQTPAQIATRGGHEALAKWLVAYRPNPVARPVMAPSNQARPKDYVPLPRMPAKPGPRRPGHPVS